MILFRAKPSQTSEAVHGDDINLQTEDIDQEENIEKIDRFVYLNTVLMQCIFLIILITFSVSRPLIFPLLKFKL